MGLSHPTRRRGYRPLATLLRRRVREPLSRVPVLGARRWPWRYRSIGRKYRWRRSIPSAYLAPRIRFVICAAFRTRWSALSAAWRRLARAWPRRVAFLRRMYTAAGRHCRAGRASGVEKDDLEVSAHGDTLTLRGTRRPAAEEEFAYHRNERRSGAFTRSASCPTGSIRIGSRPAGERCAAVEPASPGGGQAAPDRDRGLIATPR